MDTKYNNALTACEFAIEVWAEYTGADVDFIGRFCSDFYYLVSRCDNLYRGEMVYFVVDDMFITSFWNRTPAYELYREIHPDNKPMLFWIERGSDLKFSLGWK